MKDFLDQIRKREDLSSEAELAKTIGISPQALHQHKTSRSKHFSEPVAFNIAKLLNLNPAYVLLCLRVEAAENRYTKSIWVAMLNKVDRYAAALLVALTLFHAPLDKHQITQGEFLKAPTMYIMSNVRKWLLGLIRRFGGLFAPLFQHRFCNVPI